MTAAEAAAVLREVVDGRRALRLTDARRPWIGPAVGEVAFVAGYCELVFFADSASLDHLASITPAGGARRTFEQWLAGEGTNPVDLLDEGERGELEQRLYEAA